MTEEEAKGKVCPVGAMRASYDDNWDKGRCIGSRCMAWRSVPAVHVPADSVTPKMLVRKAEGYCGLVGRPS